MEGGISKVNTEDTVPKVHVSLKHGTAQLGRVPGRLGSSLGSLPIPHRVGRCKPVLGGPLDTWAELRVQKDYSEVSYS